MTSATAPNQEPPELETFASDYNVVGGLRSHASTQRFLARRRSDGQDVVITTARVLPDNDNNSLAHLATDAQLLRTLSHPNVARVVDGRWIGSDTFATVTERQHGDTVQELLDRGRQFPNTRIAILLEDVHAALEWARQQGIIHRGVNPDEMVFERGTNRLIITLTRSPIPINGVPDATSDARSIGRLAWTLLSGEIWTPETEQMLCELVPNLARRVTDDTMMMSRLKDGQPTPDVMAYIGVVAAGDVLKRAEIDLIALKDEVTEWRETEYRRFERRKKELEEKARADTEALTKEREDFRKFESDERAAITAERSELESNSARRQKRLTEVRDELEAQRKLLEQRLGELETHRVEVEQLHKEALEASRAASAAIAIKPRVLSPIDRVVAVVAGPERKENEPVRPRDWRGYARWLMPSISVALLMLAIALGIGLAHRSHRSAPSVVTVGGSKIIARPPAGLESGRDPHGNFLSQSAGGKVVPPTGQAVGAPVTSPAAAATLPAVAMPPADSADSAFTRDSLAAARARVDSVAAARRRQNARRLAQIRLDSIAHDSMARRNTIVPPDTSARPDTSFRRDSIARRDTIVRHDTLVRHEPAVERDTIARPPRDTLVRSDTAIRSDTLASVWRRSPVPFQFSSVTKIRDAGPDDHPTIRELTLRAYAEYAKIMDAASWLGLEQALHEALASDAPAQRIVAEDAGHIVGSAMLFAAETDAYGALGSRLTAPEIRLVAVAPEARGRGIARALVAECIRRAREQGANEVGLHTSGSMRAAMAMYAALGFERAPERDFQPPGSELVEGYRLILA